MKGVAFGFFFLGILAVILGMLWGIQMSASADHTLAPAHAHLNLIGWVTFGLMGLYYHLMPSAADTRLARTHLLLAVVGLVLIVPGIVLAINEVTEAAAIAGSFVTLAAMLVFAVVVWRGRAAV